MSLGAGLLLPVYSDEIGWRFQERAAVDGGVDIMFNDLCGANSMGHPPWFMLPARWFSASANQAFADPLFVRLSGVICAAAWAALLWTLISRLETDRTHRMHLHAFVFALLGLGVLPFLLVMSRPEQPIMLTITIAMLITLAKSCRYRERKTAWLKCSAIIVLVTIATSYHMKGVLYAPVALVCLAVCARGRHTLLPRGLAIGVVSGITFASAHYWADHMNCGGGNRFLAAHYARENIASLLTGYYRAPGVIMQLLSGLNPFNYVALAMASNHPMSQWMPAALFSPAELLILNGGMLAIWLVAAGFALRALLQFLAAGGVRRLLHPRVLIALAILGCVLVWGASQLHRNDYEAAHVLPMLVLFMVLCLSLPRSDAAGQALVPARFVRAMVLFAAASQIVVLALLLPPLAAAARVPGYLDNQPFSVSVGNYRQIRRDIMRAIALSGMPQNRPLNRLLVDDVTYLALQKNTLPLHRLGVLEVWNDGIDDPVGYLRSRGSDGVVLGCRYLPSNMLAVASRSGEVCAISRAGLARIAATDRHSPTFSEDYRGISRSWPTKQLNSSDGQRLNHSFAASHFNGVHWLMEH